MRSLYAIAMDVASILREVPIVSYIERVELARKFAFGFYPDSYEKRVAFINQCVGDYCEWCRGIGYLTNPDDLEKVPCGCKETQPIIGDVPGDLPTVSMPPVDISSLKLAVGMAVEERETPTCCYFRPSPNYPHGDYRRPCTADADWVILEQLAPEYEEVYACDVHLPRLLTVVNGHQYNRHDFVFTVWPVKMALPDLDPDDEDDDGDYEELVSFDRDYDEDEDYRDDEIGYIYSPDDDPDEERYDRTGPRNDPDFDVNKEFTEMLKRFEAERAEKVRRGTWPHLRMPGYFDTQIGGCGCLGLYRSALTEEDLDRLLKELREAVEADTPNPYPTETENYEESMEPAPLPKDYFRPEKFGEHLGDGKMRLVHILEDYPDDDTPAGVYMFDGVCLRVVKLWGLTYSFPVDENGEALEPDEDPHDDTEKGELSVSEDDAELARQAYIALDIQTEPDRCAVCGMSGSETYLGYCLGCGELTCGRCMVYKANYENTYKHDIEDHLRYEEFHGHPDPSVAQKLTDEDIDRLIAELR